MSSNIRALMVLTSKHQADLAEALGMSQAAVSRRLTAAAAWTIDELEQVARVLDVPLVRLLPQGPAEFAVHLPRQAGPGERS